MKQNKKQTYLPATKTQLPMEIAGLSYRGRTEYTDPTIGIQIRYDDENRSRADVYEYKEVVGSPDLTIHYFYCVNEILESEDDYRAYVKLMYQQILQYDKHRFLVSWFLLQDYPEGGFQYSMLAVAEHDGHYLKVRYSIRLPRVRRTINVALLNDRVLDFLDELVGAL